MTTAAIDDPRYQAILEREKEEEEKRRKIPGMPTEEQSVKITDAFQAAFDELESVAFRVAHIAESDDGAELQFQITFEDLGILYALSSTVRSALNDVERNLKRIDDQAFSLETIRQEQRRALER